MFERQPHHPRNMINQHDFDPFETLTLPQLVGITVIVGPMLAYEQVRKASTHVSERLGSLVDRAITYGADQPAPERIVK